MAITVKHKTVVQIARDTALKKKGPIFLDDDPVQLVSTTAFDRAVGGDLYIADAATESLDLGDVTDARGIYLELSGQCELTLNGSNVALVVQPDASDVNAKILLNATITSVSIENTSGSAVTGVYAIWGDPNA